MTRRLLCQGLQGASVRAGLPLSLKGLGDLSHLTGRRCFSGTSCPPADWLEKQSANLGAGGVHELSLKSPELSAPMEIQ